MSLEHRPIELTDAASAPCTLVEALEWRASRTPDRIHVQLADRDGRVRDIPFRALRREAIAVAAGLRRRGVRPGDTVAIMLPTGYEFFGAFYGALYAGAIPVPLYPPARATHLESHLKRLTGILANADARVLLTFGRARLLAPLLRMRGAHLCTVATVEEIADRQASLAPPDLDPEDTAFLQYTSGSTGQPKGVVLTHANLLANLNAMQEATGVTASDCFVSWLPLYHDMGLIGAAFGSLVFGFRLVVISPLDFLARPERWLRAIQQQRATITAAPNFAYELCANKVDEHAMLRVDLSSLRLAFNGAEPVSVRTLDHFTHRFELCGFRREALMPVYGLAECALGLAFPPPGRGPRVDRVNREAFLREGVARRAAEHDSAPLCVVSCGHALPGHAIRIADGDGRTLPERRQGRIEFRGPSATRGYFRNPEATARLYDGDWLDTGDLGYLADGELYVTGRAKDIIIRCGHKIHPQELEECIARLPGVRKGGVAIFPATDPEHETERVVALVELQERRLGLRNDLTALRNELTSQINHRALELIGMPVDEVVFVAPRTVLKTSSGKIRRTACREAYERGEFRS
ncbi:MAG: fatty acyl-AMP ligase [Steroidobacteraceae bacterium]|nr:fatty acyl-AMP ligase [Steroidobacteraceae bacterium]